MNKHLRDQIIALSLTLLTCGFLIFLLWLLIGVINAHSSEPISTQIRLGDVLIGLTVYLKTSIDFAIFIGRLMDKNRGLKGRIGIEIGTALGNAAGTMAILVLWVFFREVNWLLAIMIILAALVLLRLAEDGFDHIDTNSRRYPRWFRFMAKSLDTGLTAANKVVYPFLSKIIPSNTLKVAKSKTFLGLLAVSFSIPFILGLDDFAGYVPLFNVVNVFGFAIGVFIGHMVLNILLYISPKKTISAVKNPLIAFVGSIAFIGLAIWGFVEAYRLLFVAH